MALGICEYIRDAYNVFDAIIAAASFIEIGLEFSSSSSPRTSGQVRPWSNW